MAHKRTSIRNNVTTLTGLTTTGSNVFESRIISKRIIKITFTKYL